MSDTIFALSSGAPPAAIGVIRVSGPDAGTVMAHLTGSASEPRSPSLQTLRNHDGDALDQALIIWFPGPSTATGEDLLELHCHGGRAVIAAVEQALAAIDGLRLAEPGEFTRRAFANGRIDLSEADGLADLLAADTELQRAAAIQMAGGVFSRETEQWRERLLRLSAQVEAALDFSDEDDVEALPQSFADNLADLAGEVERWLARPRAEKLGEGVRVVLAGPPNTGKSTLFNALTDSEAAITSPIAGTTRDVIERAVGVDGVPFVFVDTAGLRGESDDAIEVIGIERAERELAKADLVLWLGPQGEGPKGSLEVAARSDAPDFEEKSGAVFTVSAISGEGIVALRAEVIARAKAILPKPGEAALNQRQHGLVSEAHKALLGAGEQSDPLIAGEELRRARLAFDRLIGRATTEDMLDALFGRFCIGK